MRRPTLVRPQAAAHKRANVRQGQQTRTLLDAFGMSQRCRYCCKVENRNGTKNSAKADFDVSTAAKPVARYDGPWSFLCERLWSLTSPLWRDASAVPENFARRPKKTFFNTIRQKGGLMRATRSLTEAMRARQATRRSFNATIEKPIVVSSGRAFIPAFSFQDLTQYQECYWPKPTQNSQPLCVGFLQSRS